MVNLSSSLHNALLSNLHHSMLNCRLQIACIEPSQNILNKLSVGPFFFT